MNLHIATVIVVPLTTTIRQYPSRVEVQLRSKRGQAALDQIRAIDKTRMVKNLGAVPKAVSDKIASVLIEMFQRQ
jgi:mRNA interferase MazF